MKNVVMMNNAQINKMLEAGSLVTYYGKVGGFHKVVETPDGFLRKKKVWFFAVGTLRPQDPKAEAIMLRAIERHTYRQWK